MKNYKCSRTLDSDDEDMKKEAVEEKINLAEIERCLRS